MMLLQIALLISVVLQFAAFFITISLIPKTKFNISWISISIGFFLMAVRRTIDLILIYSEQTIDKQSVLSSSIAVAISVMMFVASFYIRKIFQLQYRIDKMRRENESKVLSVIIRTEEKSRGLFAKELHDGLGPVLSAIKMSVTAIDVQQLDHSNGQIVEKIRLAADNALVAVKEISNKISPQLLDRYGLLKALTVFVDQVSSELLVRLESNIGGQRFSNIIEFSVYRIVCELIANTIKHAEAKIIDLSITSYHDVLELQYTDDGKGFDIKKAYEKGMGLSNIRSRVHSLNGQFELYTKDGKGFFVKIQLKK